MDWHRRYLQQARWTRELRTYLFERAGLKQANRVLEVGCGTGAILAELSSHATQHGLDIDPSALALCHVHVPFARLVRGNALELPYPDEYFDIIYCHYFLLWVRRPLEALLEMKRVARDGASIIAFAEPDYNARVEEPSELVALGKWQTESLRRQGADPGLGSQLADLFFRAGIKIRETGPIQNAVHDLSPAEWESEWAVLESDLTGFISSEEIQKMKGLDQRARKRGIRVWQVPTYFAWGNR
jgi:ubiquinone/menaquinone biosynthesis C-methylase UbiE